MKIEKLYIYTKTGPSPFNGDRQHGFQLHPKLNSFPISFFSTRLFRREFTRLGWLQIDQGRFKASTVLRNAMQLVQLLIAVRELSRSTNATPRSDALKPLGKHHSYKGVTWMDISVTVYLHCLYIHDVHDTPICLFPYTIQFQMSPHRNSAKIAGMIARHNDFLCAQVTHYKWMLRIVIRWVLQNCWKTQPLLSFSATPPKTKMEPEAGPFGKRKNIDPNQQLLGFQVSLRGWFVPAFFSHDWKIWITKIGVVFMHHSPWSR